MNIEDKEATVMRCGRRQFRCGVVVMARVLLKGASKVPSVKLEIAPNPPSGTE